MNYDEANNFLHGFVENLDAADSMVIMESVFAKALRQFGIAYYSYHIVRAGGTSARLPYVITNYPEDWIKRYKSSGYLEEDPILSESLRRKTPFSWSDVTQPEDLGRHQRKMMDEARDVGISNGFTIPLSGDGTENAALSIIPGSGRDAVEALSRSQNVLHLLALYFHKKVATSLIDKSMTAGSSRRQSILSPREKEVLEWIARGKSVWEIASILNISEKSIEFHTEGAKRKLQVFNRTHAVVKAMMMGLLTI